MCTSNRQYCSHICTHIRIKLRKANSERNCIHVHVHAVTHPHTCTRHIHFTLQYAPYLRLRIVVQPRGGIVVEACGGIVAIGGGQRIVCRLVHRGSSHYRCRHGALVCRGVSCVCGEGKRGRERGKQMSSLLTVNDERITMGQRVGTL